MEWFNKFVCVGNITTFFNENGYTIVSRGYEDAKILLEEYNWGSFEYGGKVEWVYGIGDN